MKNSFTVFVSPQSTFERVREKSGSSWIAPLVIVIVLSLITIYFQMPTLEKEMIKTFDAQGIDPSMQEMVIATSKVTSYVFAVIMPVMMVFLGGLLLMLVNLFIRGEAKYMQLVNVSAYSSLPSAIGGLLTGLLMWTSNVQSVTEVSLSLGALVADKSSALFKMASILNPFSIWGLVLMIIGMTVMSKRPRKLVAAWIVVGWLLISIGSSFLY